MPRVTQMGSCLAGVGSQLSMTVPALAGYPSASLIVWSQVSSINTKMGGGSVMWDSHHVLFQL